MANLSNLGKKKPKPAAYKGEPPTPIETTQNLKQVPREGKEPRRYLNLSVPESVADEFDQEALKRFGFKKGSKADMFIALWQEYREQKIG